MLCKYCSSINEEASRSILRHYIIQYTVHCFLVIRFLKHLYKLFFSVVTGLFLHLWKATEKGSLQKKKKKSCLTKKPYSNSLNYKKKLIKDIKIDFRYKIKHKYKRYPHFCCTAVYSYQCSELLK